MNSVLFSAINHLQPSVNVQQYLSDEATAALNNPSNIQTDFQECREQGMKESDADDRLMKHIENSV